MIDLYYSIEIAMAKEYVYQQRSGYVIEDTRVSLDSVVYAFLCGESPEGIIDSFPAYWPFRCRVSSIGGSESRGSVN